MCTFLIYILTLLLVHYCISTCLESRYLNFVFKKIAALESNHHADSFLSSGPSDAVYSDTIWGSLSDFLQLLVEPQNTGGILIIIIMYNFLNTYIGTPQDKLRDTDM